MYYNKKSKDKKALIDDQGYSMTYGEVEIFIKEISETIEEGSLVFALCSNSVASLAGYIAFVENKIVPLMLNADVTYGICRNLIELYKPKYIFLPSKIRGDYKEYSCVLEYNEYCLLRTNCELKYKVHPELEVLMPTSGSTGSPKFVRISRQNFEANVEALVQHCSFDEEERYITMLPMAQIYGLSRIRCQLRMGNTILLTDRKIMEKEFWEFFEKNEATSFGAVPYMYELLERIGFYSFNLPSIRFMSIAGGKVSQELKNKIVTYVKKNNIKFDMYYGSTEVCGAAGFLFFHEEGEDVGDNCIGKPLAGVHWDIYDEETGNVLNQPGEMGELWLTGESCAWGYAEQCEDLEKDDEWKNIYRTGDLVWKNENGYYYMAGRKKRFEKVFGNRINLDDVEKTVQMFLSTGDCACVGEENKIYIFITPRYTEKEKEIQKLLTSKTGIYVKGFEIKVIEEIPRTSAGKIAYGILEQNWS